MSHETLGSMGIDFVDKTRIPRERAIRKVFHHQPNGLVTPCVYMPSRIVGDLRKSSFAEIWNQPLESAFSDPEDCGDHCGVCDYRSFCGGCRARADGYTGDMLAGDPGCVYNRHMWDEITNLQQNGQEILYSLAASSVELENRDEIGKEVLT